MAATSNYMASTSFSMLGYRRNCNNKDFKKRSLFTVSAQQTDVQEVDQTAEPGGAVQEETINQSQQASAGPTTPLRPADKQVNVRNRNMSAEFGSEWLSSTTRHVRIFAAYIDPETCAFDQRQTDKLTLVLDPTDEFVWTDETCGKVFSYFQELVDHYEGAPLTEYTLRLIGSDIEHYIRKLLYQGEIQYNMNARVLNFSMGKPRIGFSYDGELEDVK